MRIKLKDILEKKIGFNRGPEYSEETEDLLNDFAKSTEMINKELSKKVVSNDDPKVQEILNILDDNLDSEFIDDLETVYNLIQELPDKPTEKPKVGISVTGGSGDHTYNTIQVLTSDQYDKIKKQEELNKKVKFGDAESKTPH